MHHWHRQLSISGLRVNETPPSGGQKLNEGECVQNGWFKQSAGKLELVHQRRL